MSESPPIVAPNATVAAAASKRLAGVSASPGGDRLKALAAWVAATQDQMPPRQLVDVRLTAFAGDHSVSASTPPTTPTGRTVRALLRHELPVNAMAAAYGVAVRILDIATDDDFDDLDPDERVALQQFKVRRNSGVVDIEDSLSPAETSLAFDAGVTVAQRDIESGAQLLVPHLIGAESSTSAVALVAALLHTTASELLDSDAADIASFDKAAVIETALSRVAGVDEPVTLLGALAGADLAAATGFIVMAARCGIPVLIDDPASAACALTAERIAPGVRSWVAVGHQSAHPAQAWAVAALDLTAVVSSEHYYSSIAEPLAALPLIRTAAAMLAHTAEFGDLT